MIRVLLADDHVLVAEGLASLIQTRFALMDIVYDGRTLVERAEQLRPDVIIADISMPGLNGLDAAVQILRKTRGSKIILLSTHLQPDLAVQAFRAGVCGYLGKVAGPEELMQSIESVAMGRRYVSSAITEPVRELMAETPRKREPGLPLTRRQREVLQLIGEGYTMREIADVLSISPRTAESHKYEIMRSVRRQQHRRSGAPCGSPAPGAPAGRGGRLRRLIHTAFLAPLSCVCWDCAPVRVQLAGAAPGPLVPTRAIITDLTAQRVCRGGPGGHSFGEMARHPQRAPTFFPNGRPHSCGEGARSIPCK